MRLPIWMSQSLLKMDQATDGKDGAPNSQTDAGAQADGDTDDFGYPIPKEEKKTDGEQPPAPEAAAKTGDGKEPEKVEGTTGYGEKEPEAPAPKVEDKKPEPVKLDYELKTDGLEPEEVNRLSAIFKKTGVSKEAAQALVDDVREQTAAAKKAEEDAQKEYDRKQAETRAAWHAELKNDSTFGGEHFAHNLKRVEKVVSDFMPNTKKILTERKTMLPPYVMRDLKGMADKLFGSASLANGNPPAPPAPEEDENDHLSFYGKQG